MSEFKPAEVYAISGVSQKTLEAWRNRGLIDLRPRRGPCTGSHRSYSRVDLLRVMAAAVASRAGQSPQSKIVEQIFMDLLLVDAGGGVGFVKLSGVGFVIEFDTRALYQRIPREKRFMPPS